MRNTPNIPKQTPYATKTPEAKDARIAHTNTNESLKGTVPLLSLPAMVMRLGQGEANPKPLLQEFKRGRTAGSE
jgi:hypothetical protein